jgi:hypothetical protein
LDAVIGEVTANAELLALNAVDDVLLTLRALKEIKDDAHLDQFDSIQINRGGVNLLRVVNRARDVNRSAYIEINTFRRHLHQVIVIRDVCHVVATLWLTFDACQTLTSGASPYAPAIAAALAVLLVQVAPYLGKRFGWL